MLWRARLWKLLMWGTNSFRISDDVNVFLHTDVSSEDSRSVYLQQTEENGTILPQTSLFPPLRWQWCLLVQTEDPRFILQECNSNSKHLAAHSSLKDRSYMSKSIRQSRAGETPGFGFACPFKWFSIDLPNCGQWSKGLNMFTAVFQLHISFQLQSCKHTQAGFP